MALITFLSDFGLSDHYVASVKAKMLSVNPALNIVDISHQIAPYDIAHASFVLNSAFRDFPKGTVHLVSVNTTSNLSDGFIAVKLEEHIFLGANNGLLSMISEHEPGIIVNIGGFHARNSNFPTRDILAPIAAKVASGQAIHDFGGPLPSIRRMMPRQFKATKKQISGYVLRVDNYGNLITNIRQDVFNTLNKNGEFNIVFGRESLQTISTNYDDVVNGECFALFNSLGLLEIGISQGNGSELLGLHYDSPVYVEFKQEG
ncbi:SAM hydrolase/SAM-dependent halogenase family protein [Penaeicola halotolerans]|uniref:SAM hydrolase/SAM-dependent halogenase family protein n=1 Tax=Penaeicola halotolerans TaxID=2793196 RepID=UPI001CF8573B|nr:SAM-dependent chlorinase/fluorinase [Penaeicola halotolerans]